MGKLTLRDKSILAGLYFSKFSELGLASLGFDNFTEAFNVVGLALGVQARSVKNYRDEFDPLFPNERLGWHKRATRKYCRDIYDAYHHLDLSEFTLLIKTIVYENRDLDVLMEEVERDDSELENTFAKRLITGQAAEQYFRDSFASLDLFQEHRLYDTTRMGCGFDFKLVKDDNPGYFGVEVKGLNDRNGSIALTSKEFAVAGRLQDRYFLFIVKNFRDKPFHQIFRDPIKALSFNRTEQQIIQTSWTATV